MIVNPNLFAGVCMQISLLCSVQSEYLTGALIRCARSSSVCLISKGARTEGYSTMNHRQALKSI